MFFDKDDKLISRTILEWRERVEQYAADHNRLYTVSFSYGVSHTGEREKRTVKELPAQMEAFGLPGEVIEKPLPYWKESVHPDDWERFYKSNMEIGENKRDAHYVEFLKNAPIDLVKIDRSFVRDILRSKFDSAFINFVVAICHDVNIKVCQEGVEAEEEYALLKEIGVDCIQGYYFGKPLDEDGFTKKLRESLDKRF